MILIPLFVLRLQMPGRFGGRGRGGHKRVLKALEALSNNRACRAASDGDASTSAADQLPSVSEKFKSPDSGRMRKRRSARTNLDSTTKTLDFGPSLPVDVSSALGECASLGIAMSSRSLARSTPHRTPLCAKASGGFRGGFSGFLMRPTYPDGKPAPPPPRYGPLSNGSYDTSCSRSKGSLPTPSVATVGAADADVDGNGFVLQHVDSMLEYLNSHTACPGPEHGKKCGKTGTPDALVVGSIPSPCGALRTSLEYNEYFETSCKVSTEYTTFL